MTIWLWLWRPMKLSIKHHNCVNLGTFSAFFSQFCRSCWYRTRRYKHTSCGNNFPERDKSLRTGNDQSCTNWFSYRHNVKNQSFCWQIVVEEDTQNMADFWFWNNISTFFCYKIIKITFVRNHSVVILYYQMLPIINWMIILFYFTSTRNWQ